jgi:hypothetical protein
MVQDLGQAALDDRPWCGSAAQQWTGHEELAWRPHRRRVDGEGGGLG